MGNRWASVTGPPPGAGAPLAALPRAAVLGGAAVPDEPPHAATSAAVMPAPRQAHSTRRAPPLPPVMLPHFPRVIGAENSPRPELVPRSRQPYTARVRRGRSLLQIMPGPGRRPPGRVGHHGAVRVRG